MPKIIVDTLSIHRNHFENLEGLPEDIFIRTMTPAYNGNFKSFYPFNPDYMVQDIEMGFISPEFDVNSLPKSIGTLWIQKESPIREEDLPADVSILNLRRY